MNESRRYKLGLVFTTLWLVAWGVVLFFTWDSASNLDLNEWGDFFAGIVGPIALGWLVLGYLQQGDDLRVNTDALKLQAKELRNQVEESRRIAEATLEATVASIANAKTNEERLKQERLSMHLSARPVFIHDGEKISSESTVVHLGIQNKGMRVVRVKIDTLQENVSVVTSRIPSIETNQKTMLSFRGDSAGLALPIDLRLHYTNAWGKTMYSDLRWSDGQVLETLIDYHEDVAETYT